MPNTDCLERGSDLTTRDGHVEEFWGLFSGLSKRWVKVEFLQEYDESGSPAYRTFREGDHREAERLVKEMVRSQTEFYSLARERGLEMIRIRVYWLPLSDYLRYYEIPAYEADVECGEDVRFLPGTRIPPGLCDGLTDYVLFDDERVVTLEYEGTTPQLRRARLVEGRESVDRYLEITRSLLDLSERMHDDPVYREVGPDAARTPWNSTV